MHLFAELQLYNYTFLNILKKKPEPGISQLQLKKKQLFFHRFLVLVSTLYQQHRVNSNSGKDKIN